MSNLSAFLNPVNTEETREVVISQRFQDENGFPVPFVIRPISQEENERITKLATRTIKVNGQPVDKLNNLEYGRRLVVAATVTPDFASEELCVKYGTRDPLEVPPRMLLVGEYAKLSMAIMELSGLNDDVEGQAKN